MTSNQDIANRRNHKRYHALDSAIAAFWDRAIKVGQIIDINIAGLSFQYIDEGEQPNRSFDLDIFLTNNGFRMERVPAQTISDCEIVNEIPFSSIIMRRCGVQFEELTDSQMSQ